VHMPTNNRIIDGCFGLEEQEKKKNMKNLD
jgi:hypothetical protein